MRRFFFNPSSRKGDIVLLSEEESRHIAKVLRLAAGDSLELLDGLGAVYHAVITATGRQVEVEIVGITRKEPAADTSLRVWQGILKGEKMDTVVQKCTELGVTGMVPFHSARCQGKLDATQALKKHARWQRVAMAACKQCLRLRAMQIDAPATYAESLGINTKDQPAMRLLFWEEEKKVHLHDIAGLDSAGSLALMLGPEGGFTREEVDQARLLGWRTVGLGDRILRAETATLSAVAIVQYLTGNL